MTARVDNEGQLVLSGVLPVLSIPLDDGERPDLEVLADYVDWVWRCGVDGVCLAMVSEWLRFDDPTRERIVASVIEATEGRGPVVVSVGAEATSHAVLRARAAERLGASAIMATPPSLNPVAGAALCQYFTELAESVVLPLVVQDASSYVGQAVSTTVQVELVRRFGRDRVLLKPESLPIGPTVTAIVKESGRHARVFEGLGGAALVDCFGRGIVGTMPGGELPDILVAIWTALGKGDQEQAERLHRGLLPLLTYQSSLDSFIAVEKYILVRRGLFSSARVCSPSSFELDSHTRHEIDRRLDHLLEVMG